MQIRRFQESDAEELARLHELSWRHFYREIVPKDLLEFTVNELFKPELYIDWNAKGIVYVAEDNGKIVGFSACHMKDAGTGYLRSIYLRPGHEGRGLGTALLKKAMDWLKVEGAKSVRTDCLADNDGAISFYEKNGFRKAGRDILVNEDKVTGKKWESGLVVMELKLSHKHT